MGDSGLGFHRVSGVENYGAGLEVGGFGARGSGCKVWIAFGMLSSVRHCRMYRPMWIDRFFMQLCKDCVRFLELCVCLVVFKSSTCAGFSGISEAFRFVCKGPCTEEAGPFHSLYADRRTSRGCTAKEFAKASYTDVHSHSLPSELEKALRF